MNCNPAYRKHAVSCRAWGANALAVCSGLLLWTAYPPLEQQAHAWVALVPLLFVARHTRMPRAAFFRGWLAGMAFWLPGLSWLWRLIANEGPPLLVVIGHLGLASYCALYMGLFALGVNRLWHTSRGAAPGTLGRMGRVLLGEPLLWVGAELLRARLFTGFAWNHLGVSQYRSLGLIQWAEWGGVYAVSALLLLFNSALTGVVERIVRVLRRESRVGWQPEFALALVLTAAAWIGGEARMRRFSVRREGDRHARIAVIQPNAPSIFAIDEAAVEDARDTLRIQSRHASAARPDLIVWPETALHGALPTDMEALLLVRSTAADLATPLLVGAMEVEFISPGGARFSRTQERIARFYNSSFLFEANGELRSKYRKQHLVPFGEYIPFDRHFPWLERLSPIGLSCRPGTESTLMRVRLRDSPGHDLVFSPLICFESTVSPLARRAVRSGARLLINQTNDAWFEGSSEPVQHLAQAVFRCIETRTPMARSANSGVSGVIDRSGRMTLLTDGERRSGFSGFLVKTIVVSDQAPDTLYMRYGDLTLGYPAVVFLLLCLFADRILRRTRIFRRS